MEISPFPYHGPLEPDQVHGRDDLVADVLERATARRVTAILGPRRYGKTSLLQKVAAELRVGGAAIVWIDLYEVASIVDVAVRIDDALAGLTGPLAASANKIAAGLDINLGVVKVHFASRDRPDPEAVLHSRIDVLVRAALAHPTVIVIDEFSGIVRVPGFAGLLRTKLQHHFQEIGLLFAGSEPSTMRTLFTDRDEPFYAQADLVHIGPLDRVAVADIVGAGFRSTGRDAGNLAGLIHQFSGGHPQRTMQLADAAWRAATPGDRFDMSVWDAAVADIRRATASGNERIYSSFENREKDVLRVLASGGSIFGRAAELLDVSNGAAQTARASLLASGDIIEVDRTYELVDPVLADWIRQRLPI
ncbi:MAG: ATP-binding protein [Acidimicrobiia bacterium]|nr:ATP-binding protein [Acidimicrobiia bacterium]